MPIDEEPLPRSETLPWHRIEVRHGGVYALPRDILTPDAAFFDVLRGRSSRTGGPLSERELSSVLWHAMQLRESRRWGRFGIGWESRNAPSAGGLHPLRILCIPLDDSSIVGLHEPEAHALLRCAIDDKPVRLANRKSVFDLLSADTGTTLQIVADPTKIDACYINSDTLLLRDVGALVATISLVATALRLTSCTLGRTGTDICRSAGLATPYIGLGAVHIGSAQVE